MMLQYKFSFKIGNGFLKKMCPLQFHEKIFWAIKFCHFSLFKIAWLKFEGRFIFWPNLCHMLLAIALETFLTLCRGCFKAKPVLFILWLADFHDRKFWVWIFSIHFQPFTSAMEICFETITHAVLFSLSKFHFVIFLFLVSICSFSISKLLFVFLVLVLTCLLLYI